MFQRTVTKSVEEITQTLEEANNLFEQQKYRIAFDCYQEVYNHPSTADHVKLYCKVQMLICQLQKRTLSVEQLIDRARTLCLELSDSKLTHPFFQGCKTNLQKLAEMLNTEEKQTHYVREHVQTAINLIKQGKFVKYADMFEIDLTVFTHEANFLGKLHKYILSIEGQLNFYCPGNNLREQLSATIAIAYHNCIEDVADVQMHKKLLYLARINFWDAIAIKCDSEQKISEPLFFVILLNLYNRKFKVGEPLIGELLHVLEELYNLESNEVLKAKLFDEIHHILDANIFKKMVLVAKDEFQRADYIEERDYHRAAFAEMRNTLAKRLKHEGYAGTWKDYIASLTDAVTLAASQKYIDSLLMPPPQVKPAVKRRRIGEDMYAPTSDESDEEKRYEKKPRISESSSSPVDQLPTVKQ